VSKIDPVTLDELVDLPALRVRFPAFDGRNGRLSHEEVVECIREWWDKHPRKRWKTSAGVVAWFAKDYQRARFSYEQDQRFGRAGMALTTPPRFMDEA